MSDVVRQCEDDAGAATEAGSVGRALTRKQRQQVERQRRKAEADALRRAADKEKAETEERRAEQIAPAAQRHAVERCEGVTMRGPRLEPYGLTFKRSNPLEHLAKRSRGMAVPLITQAHVAAAERLLTAWEDGSGSIGVGASNYEPRSAGAVQSGYIAKAILLAIDKQVRARQHVEAAKAFLGALWPSIHAVVICGIDASSWAQTAGLNRQVALGFLTAALTRLLEFYDGPARAIVEQERLMAALDAVGEP